MKINFNSVINNFSFPQNIRGKNSQQSFGSVKAKQLLETIKTEKSVKNIKITFDEIVGAYNELGYDVICKRGSHAVVPITDRVNLPIVIPHGTKYINPLDVKRLQLILNGDIDKALRMH